MKRPAPCNFKDIIVSVCSQCEKLYCSFPMLTFNRLIFSEQTALSPEVDQMIGLKNELWLCVFVYVYVCVNPRRKETDLLPQCSSSSSSIIPALHVSVMLTLKELKRSQQARAHLLQVTLISWWAEHPVSLPINASMRYNSVGLGGGRWVVKLTCGPPVKYKPQHSE